MPTLVGRTTSNYNETFTEPAGQRKLAIVFWFSSGTPSISGFTLVEGSVAHNGSETNPVGVALLWKDADSSTGPHTVTGVSDPLVVCEGYDDVRAGSDWVAILSVASGSSSPFALGLAGGVIAEDGSLEQIVIGTWSFPADVPSGWTSAFQHSYETRGVFRESNAGTVGSVTVGRDGPDHGAAIRFVLRPPGEEPEPVEPLEPAPLDALATLPSTLDLTGEQALASATRPANVALVAAALHPLETELALLLPGALGPAPLMPLETAGAVLAASAALAVGPSGPSVLHLSAAPETALVTRSAGVAATAAGLVPLLSSGMALELQPPPLDPFEVRGGALGVSAELEPSHTEAPALDLVAEGPAPLLTAASALHLVAESLDTEPSRPALVQATAAKLEPAETEAGALELLPAPLSPLRTENVSLGLEALAPETLVPFPTLGVTLRLGSDGATALSTRGARVATTPTPVEAAPTDPAAAGVALEPLRPHATGRPALSLSARLIASSTASSAVAVRLSRLHPWVTDDSVLEAGRELRPAPLVALSTSAPALDLTLLPLVPIASGDLILEPETSPPPPPQRMALVSYEVRFAVVPAEGRFIWS